MFNISSFLEKFSKNIKTTEIYKKQILEIIQKQTQWDLTSESIELKDYIIYVKSSPAVKNKIFIYKNDIIKEITTSISNIKIVDIK